MNHTTCKICKLESHYIHSGNILRKYNINYFYCSHCGFMQTEDPYWLSEAYQDSINLTDVGYMSRNLDLVRKVTIYFLLFFDKKNKFLDYAGGYGVFVRMMRDIGFDFYWDDAYTRNSFAKGFEYNNQTIEAITSFESFEHFPDPIVEIEKLLKICNKIVFSTEILPEKVPSPEEWEYYGLEHGQHISFYSTKTLKHIALAYNLHYTFLDGLHFLTANPLPATTSKLFKIKKFILKLLLTNRSIKKRIIKSKTSEDYQLMKKKLG